MAGTDLPLTCEQASDVFGSTVSVYLDAGPITEASTSTVIDVSVDPPVLLREGAVAAEQLLAVCAELVIDNEAT